MVAAYRASVLSEPLTAKQVSVTVPGSVQAGDLLVLAYAGPPPTAPSGWTQLLTTTVSGSAVYVWTRPATSGDAGGTVAVAEADQTSNNSGFQLGLVAFSSPATSGAISATAISAERTLTSEPYSPGAPALPAGRFLPLYVLFAVPHVNTINPTVTTTAASMLGYKGHFNGLGLALDPSTSGGSNASQTFFYGAAGEGWDWSRVITIGISTEQSPFAPTGLAPDGAVTIDNASTRRFTWTFTDPDAGDTQSGYDLRYRVVGTSTWTTASGSTPNRFRDFAAGTFTAADYEWQVRAYDSQGLVSAWSASAFFTAAPAPAGPVFTSPTSGATIPSVTVTATISAPTLTDLQWRVLGDLSGVADTGTVINAGATISDPTARSFTATGLPNSTTVHLQARVQNGGLWSPWVDSINPISYTPPAAPTVLALPNAPTASIIVGVINPTPTGSQPTVTNWEIWRRTDSSAPIRLFVGALPSGSLGREFIDYTPASGVDYLYRAVAVGDNATAVTGAWSDTSTVYADNYTDDY